MRLFNLFEDDNNPSDEDLFGDSEMDKIRQAFITEIKKYLHRHNDNEHGWKTADAHNAASSLLKNALHSFQTQGLIAGLRSVTQLPNQMLNHIGVELSYNHGILLGPVVGKYLHGRSHEKPFYSRTIHEDEPSDEDLFGEDKSEKIRRAIIRELNDLITAYHETPWLHRHQPVEKTRAELAAIEHVRDTFIQSGIVKGLRSLDHPDLSQNIIDYLDADLMANQKIDLGKVEEKYLNLTEDEPSDDELFGIKGPNVVDADNARGIRYAPNKYKIKLNSTGEEFEIHIVDYGYAADEIWGGADNDEVFPARIDIIPPQAVSYKGKWMMWLEKHFNRYIQMDGQEFLASRLDESEPSDDELFGNEPKRADLTKVKTSTLYELLMAFKSDDRPEYANAHASLSFRIKQELARRGVQINEDEPSDTDLFGDNTSAKLFGDALKEFAENLEMSAAEWHSMEVGGEDPHHVIGMRKDAIDIRNVSTTFIKFGVKRGMDAFRKLRRSLQYEIVEWMRDVDYDEFEPYLDLKEDEPSDDELFGIDTKADAEEFEHALVDYSNFSYDNATEYEAGTSSYEELMDEGDKALVVARIFKTQGYLAGLAAFWEFDRSTGGYVSETFKDIFGIDMDRYKPMNEGEPSDDELFGKVPSLVGRKVIEAINDIKTQNINRFHEILAANHVDSMSDIDANEEENWDDLDELDELNDHLNALDKMSKIFNGSLEDGLRYYANCIDYGYSGTEREIADYVEQLVMEKFNLDMKELTKDLLGIQVDEATIAEPEEPSRPQKTQTKTKPKLDPNVFGPRADQPLANREEPKTQQSQTPSINKASRSATQQAMRNVSPTDQMRDMLGRMRDIEIDPDLDDYPSVEPRDNEVSVNVNTENLPAVAGEAIQAAGMVSPDFHQVAALPGNMAAMIRQLGKTLFGSMTRTNTSDIYVIANLGGQGPNSTREVQSVANFVRENGEDMGRGDIDFSQVMPGYTAETQQYSAAGIRWLLVRDFAGQYIYCWPEEDSKQIGGQQARLR